jgi:hypothetical protein
MASAIFFRGHRILIHLKTEAFLAEADAPEIGGLGFLWS